LYDIDLVINRTLVYGALTASVVGLYILIVGGFGALLHEPGNLLVSLVATGVVAVVFAPLRDRLQRSVNRLLYGERDDPYTVLSRLGRRLDASLAPEAALHTIVESVAQALKLPYTAITLLRDGHYATAAEAGTAVSDVVVLPLVYQGEPVGQLILGLRAPREAFSASDKRLLENLAHQAGATAHAVRLTADLRRSRERLVTAREEERRRLRRDLHDGLGPNLGSLPLKLDLAADLAEDDPAAARELLRSLKEQARTAVSDVRRLVHDLRPPSLDELGLVGAVREQAARFAQHGLRITVEAPERLADLPAAVEVAAYRIAQEALTNVVRHAEARTCVVRLALDEPPGTLRLEVTDDGRGMPTLCRAGVGLISMRERAEELGGSCLVEAPAQGGTRVQAVLSLGVDRTPEVAA